MVPAASRIAVNSTSISSCTHMVESLMRYACMIECLCLSVRTRLNVKSMYLPRHYHMSSYASHVKLLTCVWCTDTKHAPCLTLDFNSDRSHFSHALRTPFSVLSLAFKACTSDSRRSCRKHPRPMFCVTDIGSNNPKHTLCVMSHYEFTVA